MHLNPFISLLFRISLIVGLTLSFLNNCKAQYSVGGTPPSIKYNLSQDEIPVISVDKPDIAILEKEDYRANKDGLPFRYALNLPLNTDLLALSHKQELSGGDFLYRIKVTVPSALALACYFEDFYLAEGSLLYIYGKDRQQIIGAFTSVNNQVNGLFATELITGDIITLEFYEPSPAKHLSRLLLSEISYAYRGVRSKNNIQTKGFGSSGACEVNVNCTEGQNWIHQKNAVVRIAVKIGAGSYWCTGTLLNNANQDYKPYLLTADHCGSTASATDLSQWVFYFSYESFDCPDPVIEPSAKTLTGAVKKASSGGGGTQIKESDLYLVLLNNQVPPNYNPYYCGWNRMNTSSPSGVSIHHPQGDIKKISTYTTPVISSSWGSTPGSHWSVRWSQTQHGFGVTEPGSSGSPLLNAQGEVIGQLSGGESSCINTSASDLYGKFSYSWQPAGSDSSNSLHYWLDHSNSGALNIPGLAPNIVYIVANFSADQDTFTVGNSVNFVDLSSGNPVTWNWNFEGGDPPVSTDQNPKNIAYTKTGVFKVSLIAANNIAADTVEKRRYITVLPHIFPVPFNDHVNIDFGLTPPDSFTLDIFDVLGRAVKFLIHEDNPGTRYSVYLKKSVPGFYYINIKTSDLNLSKKVMFIKTE